MINFGKTLILGDSYTTFRNYVPSGFDIWYGEDIRPDHGVSDVDKTWWRQVMSRVSGELVLNSSWSGTTVCHTGWRGEDCRHKSFVGRLDKLIADGEKLNNYEIPIRIAYVLGFDETQFPVAVIV